MTTPEDDTQVDDFEALVEALQMTKGRVALLEHQLEHVRTQRGQALVQAKATLDKQTHELNLLRQQLAELGSMRDAALAANRAKSNFLATMSHELRTPLNAIIGYTELLREESNDLDHPHVRKRLLPDLAKINHAAQHLVWVINDVLDLAKIEAGRAEVHLEDFDLCEMIQALVATIGPAIKKNNNILHTQLQQGLSQVRSDKPKLRQSILNLLSNAAKFTCDGSVTLRTRTVEEGLHEWLEISVQDTGIGVPQQKIETLFDAYTQADSTTSKVYGGSGLGLAISRQFCRMLGGDITATSEVGVGSTFVIRVPNYRTDGERPAPTWHGDTGAGYSVLVIDDDPTAHELMRRILTREGFEVHTASNGGEGLRMAEDLDPDVITLDVKMPDMDGWTVLSALKEDSELERIPVVIVSMVSEPEFASKLGADGFMTKPVKRSELLDVLARFIHNDASAAK